MAEPEAKAVTEEKAPAPAPAPVRPEESPKPQECPEGKKPDAPSPPTRRRTSSGGDHKKEVPVDQETFTPPPASKSIPRSSLSGGGRGYGAGGSERNLSTAARKSKFGLSSKARMVLGSIVDIKTTAAELYDKKIARYQNTYRLESENPFNSEKVDKILREVMNEVLENLHYDPEKCASTAKNASMQIRTKVKQLDFERYKLVCLVSIGEKNSQDVYATCRFLWDPEKDRCAFYSLENTHVYAIAYCFGLYYE